MGLVSGMSAERDDDPLLSPALPAAAAILGATAAGTALALRGKRGLLGRWARRLSRPGRFAPLLATTVAAAALTAVAAAARLERRRRSER